MRFPAPGGPTMKLFIQESAPITCVHLSKKRRRSEFSFHPVAPATILVAAIRRQSDESG